MSQSTMNSKPHKTNKISIEFISKELQNNNKDSVLQLFKLILQQNDALKSSLKQIKQSSDDINHKLAKLQQKQEQHHSSYQSSSLINQIININQEINETAATSTNITHKHINTNNNHNNHCHSLSSYNSNDNSTQYNGSKCRHSIDITYDTTQHEYEYENTISNNGINDHDLSRIINGINIENSENKTDYLSECSRRTDSTTFVTDDHNFREKSVLSQRSRQEIITKLESGGRILSLIEKSETKRVSKRKMIKFLTKKGISLHKINSAYNEYYNKYNLSEIVFESYPLGFAVNKGIISSIQNKDLILKGMDIGSMIYEINGKRIDNKSHQRIIEILQNQQCPFYIIFKQSNNRNNKMPLHEHSMITSIGTDIQDVVASVSIDYERIGQILLDHRFLPSAKLINQALDHLETFCDDEDLSENGFRDEICKAWSVTDDRGILLWGILYGVLKYSEKERRWFYDLILHFYFKLSDMKTVNISFLMTAILRDLNVKKVDLVQMKEILAVHKVDGFSFNAEIATAKDFSNLFNNINNTLHLWHKVYDELVQWNPDENIKNNHIKHQKKYKNIYIHNNDNDDCSQHKNEITIFNDITRVSIRNDIDYSNEFERKEWLQYRHNIKNIFIFFAGFNVCSMKKKEFKRFLDIFSIKKYCRMHLMQQNEITMDQFIKYLCNEYINDKARIIKESIQKLPEFNTILNATKILDDIKNELINNNGILKYIDFQQFGINLSLNDLETEILFQKLDKTNDGEIYIDHIFEWLKLKLQKNPQKINKRKKRTN